MAKGVKVGNAYIEVDTDVDTGSAMRKLAEFKALADKLANITATVKVDTKGANFRDTLLAQMSSVDADVDRHSSKWGTTLLNNITSKFKDIAPAFRVTITELERDKDRFHGFGTAIGALISLGASSSLASGAQLIRNVMTVGWAGAILGVVATVAGGIQAAFAIVPPAIAAIPGLFLGTASAAGILTLGIQGMAKAISGALNPALQTDKQALEEFNTKLKQLAPSAREFVLAIVDAAPALRAFQQSIQQALFAETAQVVPRITNAVKQLREESIGVADRFRDIGVAIINMMTSAEQIHGMEHILAGVDAFLNIIRPGVLSLVKAFFDLAVEGSNFAEVLGNKVNAGLQQLAAWISNIDLGKLWRDAKPALEDVHRLASNVWEIFKLLFGGQEGKSGGGILDFLADLSEKALSAALQIKNLIAMFQGLPEPVKQVAGAVGAFALALAPLKSMVGIGAGIADDLTRMVGVLGALGVSGGVASAIVLGLVAALLALAAMIAIAWTQSEEFRTKIRQLGEDLKNTWDQQIRPSLVALKVQFEDTFNSLGALLNEFGIDWGTLADIIAIAVGGIVVSLTAITAMVGGSLTFIRNEIDFLKFKVDILKDAWNAVKEWWNKTWADIKADWKEFRDFINAGVDAIKGAFSTLEGHLTGFLGFFGGIATQLNNVWTGIREKFHETVNNIGDKTGAIADSMAARWNGFLEVVKDIWNSGWGFVKDKFHELVNNIGDKAGAIADSMASRWRGFLEVVKGIWDSGWVFIKDKFHELVNNIGEKAGAIADSMAARWRGFLEVIKGIWDTGWIFIRDKFHEIINNIDAKLHDSLNAMNGFLHTILDAIRSKWNDIWNGMHTILGDVWGKIVRTVTTGINSVIDIINAGIRGINSVLEKIGVNNFKITEIPKLAQGGPVSGGPQGRGSFASGGKIRGPGTPTSDSIPIMASRDEFVIKAKSARRIGYRNLAFINSTGRFPANHRFATGGRVSGGNNGLLEQHRNHVHVAMSVPPMGFGAIIAKAATSGFPFRVTSTYRPGDRGSSGGLSHHATGRAVDFGGYNQDGFASWWEKQAGVIELIHRTNARDYAIFGGKGGGIMSFLNEFLGKGIGWVMDKMVGPAVDKLVGSIPGGNVYGEIAKGSLIKIKDGLRAKIQAFIDSMTAAEGASGGAGGGQKWKGVAEQALKMLGLPMSWLGPLLTLIGRESGGNPNAVNRWDSNAQRGTPSMGLMQTIMPTFQAHKYPGYNNILAPLDNILAGLRYIQSRYGSIFNVQQAVGATPRGYKYGGMTRPGWNFMHEPELALNSAQGRALERRIAGDGMPNIGEVHIHIHGISDPRAVAEAVRNELVKLSRRNGGKTGLPV